MKHNKVNILGVTMTWLINSNADAVVAITSYDIYRNVATGSVCKHGVCFYIQNSSKSIHIENSIPDVCSAYLCDYSFCFRHLQASFIPNE